MLNFTFVEQITIASSHINLSEGKEISEECDFEFLEHPKIYEGKPQRSPPQKNVPRREVEMVLFDDGWPVYEEPVFGT